MCSNIILTESKKVEPNTEYRLHHIHYTGKEAEYVLSPEYNRGKNAKYSIHSKTKKPDLYTQLWEDLMESLDRGRIGKEIKKNYLAYEEELKLERESN